MKVQKLSSVNKDQLELAHKYYQVMSVLNDLKLAEGEIQLIAYSAVKGNIADPEIRDEYCKTYKTTPATINNIVYRLKKKKIILKKDKEIYVNPALTQVSFDEPLALVITLEIRKEPTAAAATKKKPTKVKKKKAANPKAPKEPTQQSKQNFREDEMPNMLNVQKYG
jgi:hypothetical protein